MKHFLLLFSITLLPALAPAQCFKILSEDGIAKLNAQRYDEAIALFQGAKKCDDKPIDGDARLDAMIAAARREAQSAVETPTSTPEAASPQASSDPTTTGQLVEKQTAGEIHWTTGYVRAKGRCIIDTLRFPNAAQARLMAERCAELVAKANLLETMQGVRLRRSSSVRDFAGQSDAIDGATEGRLRGARPLGEPRAADGMVEIELEAPLQQVYAWVAPDAPAHAVAGPGSAAAQRLYVSGALARPCLFPVLTDASGQLLFDAEARYRQSGRLVFQQVQGRPADPAGVMQATATNDNSLRIAEADWPLLRQWIEAAEAGAAPPVELVFP